MGGGSELSTKGEGVPPQLSTCSANVLVINVHEISSCYFFVSDRLIFDYRIIFTSFFLIIDKAFV